MLRTLLFSLIIPFLLSACGSNGSDNAGGVDPDKTVRFSVQGDKAIMTGVIDDNFEDTLTTMLDDHPAVNTIEMLNVPGSDNDDVNLVASRIIRQRSISTHVPANGLIASGGTDFFLAGINRTIENGARIGVHSWADGDGKAGSAYEPDHPDHQKYLDYYTEMGIPLEFYWFTLQAAPPEGMHDMTPEEIARYGVTTN